MELIFTSGHGPYASLIKWFTKSNATHASLHLFNRFLYQASGTKTNIETWKFFSDSHNMVARFSINTNLIPEAVITTATDEVLTTFGAGYDWKGILGLAWCLIVEKIFNKNIKNPWNQRSSYWCSEIVACFWNSIETSLIKSTGKSTGLYIDPDKVTPQDLIDIFRSHPEIFTEEKLS